MPMRRSLPGRVLCGPLRITSGPRHKCHRVAPLASDKDVTGVAAAPLVSERDECAGAQRSGDKGSELIGSASSPFSTRLRALASLLPSPIPPSPPQFDAFTYINTGIHGIRAAHRAAALRPPPPPA
ncbi:unnamed protein product [Urochloa humidicola]